MFELLWPAQELGLTLDQISHTGEALDLHISLTGATAMCPLCGHPSAAVHSYYPRTLCDLRVRRFFCRVVACPRRVFAEPLGPLAAPYAHRTTLLTVPCATSASLSAARPVVASLRICVYRAARTASCTLCV